MKTRIFVLCVIFLFASTAEAGSPQWELSETKDSKIFQNVNCVVILKRDKLEVIATAMISTDIDPMVGISHTIRITDDVLKETHERFSEGKNIRDLLGGNLFAELCGRFLGSLPQEVRKAFGDHLRKFAR